MSIERYKYNSEKIGHIKQILNNNARAGNPIDYEIHVDQLRVVPRTNNPEQFEEYEEFVTVDTQSVTIILYEGNSRKNRRNIFILKEDTQAGTSPLSGIDVEKIVSEKLDKQKRELEYNLLVREKDDIKSQLEEAEEYIEQLEDKIKEIAESKSQFSQKWGDIASIALEGIIRRNAHKIANFPGAAALAGIFADDTPSPESEENKEGEATFRKKATTDVEVTYERVSNDEENIISEEDKDLIEFLKHLHEKFSEEEFDQIMSIIAYLYKEPKALPATIEFLEEWEEDSDDNQTEETGQETAPEETTQQPEYSETEEFPQTC